jgi:hypothetical protein
MIRLSSMPEGLEQEKFARFYCSSSAQSKFSSMFYRRPALKLSGQPVWNQRSDHDFVILVNQTVICPF